MSSSSFKDKADKDKANDKDKAAACSDFTLICTHASWDIVSYFLEYRSSSILCKWFLRCCLYWYRSERIYLNLVLSLYTYIYIFDLSLWEKASFRSLYVNIDPVVVLYNFNTVVFMYSTIYTILKLILLVIKIIITFMADVANSDTCSLGWVLFCSYRMYTFERHNFCPLLCNNHSSSYNYVQLIAGNLYSIS